MRFVHESTCAREKAVAILESLDMHDEAENAGGLTDWWIVTDDRGREGLACDGHDEVVAWNTSGTSWLSPDFP